MDKSCKIAALYIATLKAISLIHQHNHWTTKGSNFFGNHLLFEKLYNAAQEDLDTSAEKFIGLFGDDCLSYEFQTELLNKVLLKYNNLEGSPAEMSLAVEKEFLKFSGEAYEALKADGKMTLGLDDMIMAIASHREEAVYHLQQLLKGV